MPGILPLCTAMYTCIAQAGGFRKVFLLRKQSSVPSSHPGTLPCFCSRWIQEILLAAPITILFCLSRI